MKIIMRYLLLAVLCLIAPLEPRSSRKKRSPNQPAQQAGQPAVQRVQLQTTTLEPQQAGLAPKPVSKPTLLLDLFEEKLLSSALFIVDFITVQFNFLSQIKEPKPDFIKLQLRSLIYPLKKHFREVVSAYTDQNSFLMGDVFTSCSTIQDPALQRRCATFQESLFALGEQLRTFRIQKIDKELASDIETQIEKVDKYAREMNAHAKGEELISMADRLIGLIEQSYIKPLEILLKNISAHTGIIPGRQRTTKSIKQVIKAKNWLVNFVTFKLRQQVNDIGNEVVRYGAGAASKAAGDAWGYFKLEGFMPTMQAVPKLANDLLKKGNATLSLALADPLKNLPALIQSLPPLPLVPPASALQTIQSIGVGLANPAWIFSWSQVATFGKTIGFGILENVGSYLINDYFKIMPYIYSRYIAYMQAIINIPHRAIEFLYYYMMGSRDQEALIVKIETLYELQMQSLNSASDFMSQYIALLFDGIIKKKLNASFDDISRALQALQVELFRYRRFIISEFKNQDSLTNNYLMFLHGTYIQDQNTLLLKYYAKDFLESNSGESQTIMQKIKDAKSEEERKNLTTLYYVELNAYTQERIVHTADPHINNPEREQLLDRLKNLPAYSYSSEQKLLKDIHTAFNVEFLTLDELINLKLSTNTTEKEKQFYKKIEQKIEAHKDLYQKAQDLYEARKIVKKLQGEISPQEDRDMSITLAHHLTRITNELTSFGAYTTSSKTLAGKQRSFTGSYYQTIQSVLKTNIDRGYAPKLEAHLNDLQTYIDALMKDTQRVIIPTEAETREPYYDYNNEIITIPDPRVAAYPADQIRDIIQNDYIRPLRALVEKTKPESPLWSLLPAGQTKFISVPRRTIKLGLKIISASLNYLFNDLTLMQQYRLLRACTGGPAGIAVHLAQESLSGVAQQFIGLGKWDSKESFSEQTEKKFDAQAALLIEETINQGKTGIKRGEGILNSIVNAPLVAGQRTIEQIGKSIRSKYNAVAPSLKRILRD